MIQYGYQHVSNVEIKHLFLWLITIHRYVRDRSLTAVDSLMQQHLYGSRDEVDSWSKAVTGDWLRMRSHCYQNNGDLIFVSDPGDVICEVTGMCVTANYTLCFISIEHARGLLVINMDSDRFNARRSFTLLSACEKPDRVI